MNGELAECMYGRCSHNANYLLFILQSTSSNVNSIIDQDKPSTVLNLWCCCSSFNLKSTSSYEMILIEICRIGTHVMRYFVYWWTPVGHSSSRWFAPGNHHFYFISCLPYSFPTDFPLIINNSRRMNGNRQVYGYNLQRAFVQTLAGWCSVSAVAVGGVIMRCN